MLLSYNFLRTFSKSDLHARKVASPPDTARDLHAREVASPPDTARDLHAREAYQVRAHTETGALPSRKANRRGERVEQGEGGESRYTDGHELAKVGLLGIHHKQSHKGHHQALNQIFEQRR